MDAEGERFAKLPVSKPYLAGLRFASCGDLRDEALPAIRAAVYREPGKPCAFRQAGRVGDWQFGVPECRAAG
jgi:hypothetical protein